MASYPGLPIGRLLLDERFRIVDIDPEFHAQFGDASALLGVALDELVAHRDRRGAHALATRLAQHRGEMIDLSLVLAIGGRDQFVRLRLLAADGALVAYVEPGATLADFDAAAQKRGLATPVGINSTTGIAGLTLGGGFGWLTRKYGMTVDNLRAAQVVTADGECVRASTTEHPNLFWALRGGGGNFGVVTQFEFQLHPVGPEVTAGLLVFPLRNAPVRRPMRASKSTCSLWLLIPTTKP